MLNALVVPNVRSQYAGELTVPEPSEPSRSHNFAKLTYSRGEDLSALTIRSETDDSSPSTRNHQPDDFVQADVQIREGVRKILRIIDEALRVRSGLQGPQKLTDLLIRKFQWGLPHKSSSHEPSTKGNEHLEALDSRRFWLAISIDSSKPCLLATFTSDEEEPDAELSHQQFQVHDPIECVGFTGSDIKVTPGWLKELLPRELRPEDVKDIYRFPEQVEQKILELIKVFSMTPANLNLLEERYSDEKADFHLKSFPAVKSVGSPACVQVNCTWNFVD